MQERVRIDPVRSTDELRVAYNALYAGAGIAQLPSFYRWVLSLLAPDSGKSLLDISCGSGALAAEAQRHGLWAWGVDLSDRAVRDANAALNGSYAVVGDAESLPFADGTFDYVTNIGSIEHYLHPEQGVAEIARVLNPEGKACILLPNSYSLLENVWTVLRTGDVGDQGQPIERYATRVQWERMLSENGLAIFRTVRYNLTVPRTAPDRKWYVRRPRRLLWLLASLFVPLNLSSCFVFMCRKRVG
jgi:SAM-dependent methyltransferase